uniref:Uncharacterized protein n=1 Tax=Oryza punctata TaxID=4537 RepID=A0A0E0JPF4_ORYPU
MDDDVVYLLSSTKPSTPMDNSHVVFAIDMRKRTLQGLTKLDVQPQNLVCMVTLCTSNFSTLATHHRVFLHVTICMNAMLAILRSRGWEVTVIKQDESTEGPLEMQIALPSMPSLTYFGESTSRWGSIISDGQVGKLSDILPGPAAGFFSSFTSGARYDP